ncbi:hypothetical protein RJ40_01940 [Methanofollis aquaemaris]|uniref:Uncharacterized protein n=1 Tax=Methanofollis aquaemaris TaxID=126734 RepID=A0A8A3S405_9EURY|nr:hypothetical protein [Methanofollis aquaemaris]QSZ66344.1 hypothetical protein RJ40_01940 [Methanofollis aquaemaris]
MAVSMPDVAGAASTGHRPPSPESAVRCVARKSRAVGDGRKRSRIIRTRWDGSLRAVHGGHIDPHS